MRRPIGADADDGGRLDALDGRDEILGRRVLVRIRHLEIDKVRAGRFQQSVDVEHPDSATAPPSSAMPSATRAEHSRSARPMPAEPAPRNRYFSSLSFAALDLGRVDQAGKRDARRALHVVVVDSSTLSR